MYVGTVFTITQEHDFVRANQFIPASQLLNSLSIKILSKIDYPDIFKKLKNVIFSLACIFSKSLISRIEFYSFYGAASFKKH